MQASSSRVQREKVKPGIWRRKSARGPLGVRDHVPRLGRPPAPSGRRRAACGTPRRARRVKSRMGKGERVAPNPRLTFAVACEEWIAAKSPNLTDKTIATYRYALDGHLLPALGRMKLSRDRRDGRRRVRRTHEHGRVPARGPGAQRPAANGTTGYSVQTIKSALIPLSSTFAYAKRHLGYGGREPRDRPRPR